MAKSTSGHGSIRKKEITRNGKTYHYWEARYTAGYGEDGRQIQKSVSGKTQKEVADKLREITGSINSGTYIEPSKITVKQWCDIWQETYLITKATNTQNNYRTSINIHIVPKLGYYRLQELEGRHIQRFINELSGLAPGTVKGIYTHLHAILKAARKDGYIKINPAEDISLPKKKCRELHVLDEEKTVLFTRIISGNRFENVYLLALLTGMRESEILGLTWDEINFDDRIINLKHQLVKISKKRYDDNPDMEIFCNLKNNKPRRFKPTSIVMDVLKRQRAIQSEQSLAAGSSFDNKNNLVFCDSLGRPFSQYSLINDFSRYIRPEIDPILRFHDLRHTYAVAAIRSGIDLKTISTNLGHSSVAFTLDVYATVTEDMQEEAARKLDDYFARLIS